MGVVVPLAPLRTPRALHRVDRSRLHDMRATAIRHGLERPAAPHPQAITHRDARQRRGTHDRDLAGRLGIDHQDDAE
jgi:hypothetical protein